MYDETPFYDGGGWYWLSGPTDEEPEVYGPFQTEEQANMERMLQVMDGE